MTVKDSEANVAATAQGDKVVYQIVALVPVQMVDVFCWLATGFAEVVGMLHNKRRHRPSSALSQFWAVLATVRLLNITASCLAYSAKFGSAAVSRLAAIQAKPAILEAMPPCHLAFPLDGKTRKAKPFGGLRDWLTALAQALGLVDNLHHGAVRITQFLGHNLAAAQSNKGVQNGLLVGCRHLTLPLLR